MRSNKKQTEETIFYAITFMAVFKFIGISAVRVYVWVCVCDANYELNLLTVNDYKWQDFTQML